MRDKSLYSWLRQGIQLFSLCSSNTTRSCNKGVIPTCAVHSVRFNSAIVSDPLMCVDNGRSAVASENPVRFGLCRRSQQDARKVLS